MEKSDLEFIADSIQLAGLNINQGFLTFGRWFAVGCGIIAISMVISALLLTFFAS